MEIPWIRNKIEPGKSFICNECKKSIDATSGVVLSPSKRISDFLPNELPQQIYICAGCYTEKLKNLKIFLLNNFITNKEIEG